MRKYTKPNSFGHNFAMKIFSHSLLCIFFICTMLFILGCGKEEPYPVIRCIDEEPAWSPDGRYIAYFHDPNDTPIVSFPSILFIGCSPIVEEDRRAGIWILDLETIETRFLTEGWSPNWSPDSKEIVYVNNRNIYKINVATEEIKQLTTWGSCFFPDWSPDGVLVAFDCTIGTPDSNGIWIMEVSLDSIIKHIGLGRHPDWSPDCRKIAYEGKPAVPSHQESDIWITDTSGIDTLRLTNEGGRSPVFSPDGSRIAYVSDYTSEMVNIYLIDTLGQNEVKLTDADCAIDPSWSPDGSEIVFSQRNDEANATSLWIMNSDGSGKRQITWPDN